MQARLAVTAGADFYSITEDSARVDSRRTIPFQFSYRCDAGGHELQKKYVDTAQEYDQQIQAIPIIRTRPTYSEKAEKEKLEKRKAYLLDSYARTRGGIAHENQD